MAGRVRRCWTGDGGTIRAPGPGRRGPLAGGLRRAAGRARRLPAALRVARPRRAGARRAAGRDRQVGEASPTGWSRPPVTYRCWSCPPAGWPTRTPSSRGQRTGPGGDRAVRRAPPRGPGPLLAGPRRCPDRQPQLRRPPAAAPARTRATPPSRCSSGLWPRPGSRPATASDGTARGRVTLDHQRRAGQGRDRRREGAVDAAPAPWPTCSQATPADWEQQVPLPGDGPRGRAHRRSAGQPAPLQPEPAHLRRPAGRAARRPRRRAAPPWPAPASGAWRKQNEARQAFLRAPAGGPRRDRAARGGDPQQRRRSAPSPSEGVVFPITIRNNLPGAGPDPQANAVTAPAGLHLRQPPTG